MFHINECSKHPNFCVAYTLGYYFLNFEHSSPIILNEISDQEVIVFASELLLTEEMLLSNLGEILQLNISEMAKYFDLPIIVVQVKMDKISGANLIFPHLYIEH